HACVQLPLKSKPSDSRLRSSMTIESYRVGLPEFIVMFAEPVPTAGFINQKFAGNPARMPLASLAVVIRSPAALLTPGWNMFRRPRNVVFVNDAGTYAAGLETSFEPVRYPR